MTEYILIMTLIIFQANGNVVQIETATFNGPEKCIDAGVEWSESVEKAATSSIETTFVCVRK